MNKMKLSTVSSWMAAVAAGLIMVGCGDKAANTTSGNTADSVKTATAGDAQHIDYNGKIVYIQLDSLMRGYGMAVDLQSAFEEKSLKAQNELTAKGRSLEREARDYQEKAEKGLLTRSQAMDIETGLQRKQQSVMEYRDKMMQDLSEEESVMMNQISNAIMEYMKKYNADKGYSMVISTAGANTVLIADPSLNITDDVLKGLNAEYKANPVTTKTETK